MDKRSSADMHLRLAEARERAGFASASDAARRFGWNENTYRSHENGERGLKVEVAYKYARAFRVRFEWLLIGQHSESMPTTESYVLSGYVDDEGVVRDYPTEDTGKFKKLVAISSYLSRLPQSLIEIRSNRPMYGCWPDDLIEVTNQRMDPQKIIVEPGDIGIITTQDGTKLLRPIRFNGDRTMVDIQLYPEMGPKFAHFILIGIVDCIVKKRAWAVHTMDEWEALLLDPHRTRPKEEPRRQP